jgi:hypothetical protein
MLRKNHFCIYGKRFVDMVIFRSEMELPYLFIISVDHKLLIWDKAEGEWCSFRASRKPFLSHEHDGPVFPYLPLQMDREDLIEVYGWI